MSAKQDYVFALEATIETRTWETVASKSEHKENFTNAGVGANRWAGLSKFNSCHKTLFWEIKRLCSICTS